SRRQHHGIPWQALTRQGGMLVGERKNWARQNVDRRPTKAAELARIEQFGQLPSLAQTALLKEQPPKVRDGFRAEPVTEGTAAGRAGVMFVQPTVRPSEAHRAAGRH